MSQDVSDNKVSRTMAEFISDLSYDNIPTHVLERTKLIMLDAFACGLYGARLEWAQILQKTMAPLDQTPACTIWGTRQRLSAPSAALINGTQVQGFELDDAHHGGVVHIGAAMLPVMVAIAETRKLSGKDFMTAAIAGYEIGPRVGMCMTPDHIGQGWHPAGTIGIFGGAASAARALKLNVGQTIHTLGDRKSVV